MFLINLIFSTTKVNSFRSSWFGGDAGLRKVYIPWKNMHVFSDCCINVGPLCSFGRRKWLRVHSGVRHQQKFVAGSESEDIISIPVS